jgi:hypothetical protein
VFDRKKLFSDRRALLCLGCSAFFAAAALFVSVSWSGAVSSTAAARGVRRFGGASTEPSSDARDAFRIDRDWRLGGTSWHVAGEATGSDEPVADEADDADEPGEKAEGDPMAGRMQGLDFAVSR